ncbi:hypothetical protein [Nocardia goodfellowii]|uniref:Uncharacterized protein n=1 Tax=Nocardia goodfellowii TaxID=882446 RepID=A0ABS4QS54_9NOCA|nr:hypothetical protein [Nocardia goodfellowii]MBP2194551.1 hypothetical protein [Nocardia goodfellowii]
MSVSRLPERPGTVTGLHTRRSSYHPNYGALARNRIALARAESGLTPKAFAEALSRLIGRDVQAGHITSWETTTTPPGDVLLAVGALAPLASSRIGVRSHKLIAAHVGQAGADKLRADLGMEETVGFLGKTACWSTSFGDAGDECTLHVWPWGTAVIHLIEDLDVPDVTTLAMWRYRTYTENMAWASEQLSALTGDPVEASYVLSVYWVYSAPWIGPTLETGLRLICAPRVLVDRDLADQEAAQVNGERVEHELLTAGFAPPDMKSFGAPGVSSAWASWSGVVYHPHDPLRALPEGDLVAFEIGVQAIWALTAHIAEQVESGADPQVCDRYGYGFLRGARSVLLTPRPQETGHHQQMRDAIVNTSGLPSQLQLAMEALKEAGR